MNNDRYSMSFTTGSLFHLKSVELTKLYLDLENWNFVRNKVISENLLQTRTLNTLKRVCSEIISRLKTLSLEELKFLIKANTQEQAYLLWIAVCRRYQFIADFAVEVLREYYITLKSKLTYEDFNAFFNRKSESHLKLNNTTLTTRKKLQQVLFKMLREANLLSIDNSIYTAMLSQELSTLIQHHNHRDIFYFPIFESDLKGVKR